MRITNSQLARNYTKNLQQSHGRLVGYLNQVTTGRRFNKMSEDTSAGVRAMQVRRNLKRIDAYEDNVKAGASMLQAAETNLMQMEEVFHSATELYVKAINGTNEQKDYNIYVEQFEKLREELLSLANAQFSERYLYGGTNKIAPPFSTTNGDDLLYNGVNVMEITDGHELLTDAAYMDIGAGLSFSDPANPQQADPTSVFETSLVGADFLGTGKDNIYLVLTDMINSLKDASLTGNMDEAAAGEILDHFRESANAVHQQVTKLGAKAEYLDFTLSRLASEKINLKARQESLENIPREEAIIYYKMEETAYNAALQMGTRLFASTLFDYL